MYKKCEPVCGTLSVSVFQTRTDLSAYAERTKNERTCRPRPQLLQDIIDETRGLT